MDAPCEIQRSIHVFRLVNNMCPGKWVHISCSPFLLLFNSYISINNCLLYRIFRSIYNVLKVVGEVGSLKKQIALRYQV